MKQQSMILQKHFRIFLIWLFKTKQHLFIMKMMTYVLTKITDLSALYAQFVSWFNHKIDVCLKLRVALSTMVKIYVVKHFVRHVVPVVDVKVDLGDAKCIFENGLNYNLNIFYATNFYNIILIFILKRLNENLFILSSSFYYQSFILLIQFEFVQKNHQMQYLLDHDLHTY